MPSRVEVEPNAARRLPDERLVLAPAERREALFHVIRSARHELVLSLFRCDDFKLLDELADARKRNVRVRALLTPHAKDWEKRLKQLKKFLKIMGAEVHRYSGPGIKYHAKYMVADDGPALIASLNFTRKCFEDTCDFILTTHDPGVVSGLKRLFEADWHAPEWSFPDDLTGRLIVSPDGARPRIEGLLRKARRRISIIDHRVSDPGIVALLKARQAEGVSVEVLGRGSVGGLVSHGKMILVDEEIAVIGSIALSRPSLDFRREVAVSIRDPRFVGELSKFFRNALAARSSKTKVHPVPEATS